MQLTEITVITVSVLISAMWLMELALNYLNRHHVAAHADTIPAAFQGVIDKPTYHKSIEYTLARGRFNAVQDTWSAALLVILIFSGVLPLWFESFTIYFGDTIWSMAAFLWSVGFGISLTGIAFDWYSQFRLEERFGFNTTDYRTWIFDMIKGWSLGLIIGYPILLGILKMVELAGDSWWLPAWILIICFQLLLMAIGPSLILPLFNKLTPLPDGTLRERLFILAKRTGFNMEKIQVMDGSRRSRHSNAFFIGLGRTKKTVLFDTLVEQLTEEEIESVLAHEIGHSRKKHIVKSFLLSATGMLCGLFMISILGRQPWFFEAFGFGEPRIEIALLLAGLIAGPLLFWWSPLFNLISRKFEYQADAFAAQSVGSGAPLINALKKLSEKNLANLNPHPLYSAFHYSHPTVVEREKSLNDIHASTAS